MAVRMFFDQLTSSIPIPTANLSGQTVIVTGANTGIGLEASKHFARLGCSKLILAVRTLSKGDAAKQAIMESTNRTQDDFIQVWPLDLCSYDSVIKFTERCEKLDRIDMLLENAGMYTKNFRVAEGNEIMITTNVLSTFLLALLLLSKMRDVATTHQICPKITIVGSQVHAVVKLHDWRNPNFFDQLSDPKQANMETRYHLSKLLTMFAFREMSGRMTRSGKAGSEDVVLNSVAPGLCSSGLFKDDPDYSKGILKFTMRTFARTPEEGSRCLVGAALAGKEGHGRYFNDGKIKEPSSWVRSEEGAEAQKYVWKELIRKLEIIKPGIEALI